MIRVEFKRNVFVFGSRVGLLVGLAFVINVAPQKIFAVAAKSQLPAIDSASEKAPVAADGKTADVGPKDRVRYVKSKKLDFNSQTVEGVLQRPETALITASESLSTNGILRLREDFLDKYASDIGEPVP
jgi:hypothetical protein